LALGFEWPFRRVVLNVLRDHFGDIGVTGCGGGSDRDKYSVLKLLDI
jgi:hypothetical protein